MNIRTYFKVRTARTAVNDYLINYECIYIIKHEFVSLPKLINVKMLFYYKISLLSSNLVHYNVEI